NRLQSKIILLHFYSLVTSLLFDNMFPEFTLFSSLFYLFLIRNLGFNRPLAWSSFRCHSSA
ncbi:MAG: hypothetical protein ACR5LA_12865, partial [Wolbachia sp.]